MKKTLRVASVLLALMASGQVMAWGGVGTNPSQQSTLSTLTASTIVLSPLWAPFYGSVQVMKDAQFNEREKDAKKYAVRDKYGKEQTLYIPYEVNDKIDIRNGDQVDLESDDVGVLLKKSGDPKYYFVPKEKGSLLEQTQLK